MACSLSYLVYFIAQMGKAPLMVAALNGNEECVKALLAHGAHVNAANTVCSVQDMYVTLNIDLRMLLLIL